MKKYSLIIFFIIFLAVIFSFLTLLTTDVQAYKLINPQERLGTLTGPDGISKLLGRAANVIVAAVGAFALIMFVYGGFLWTTSGGVTEKVQKGKSILVWSIIGLIIILTGYVSVAYIIEVLTDRPIELAPTTPPVSSPAPTPSPGTVICNLDSCNNAYPGVTISEGRCVTIANPADPKECLTDLNGRVISRSNCASNELCCCVTTSAPTPTPSLPPTPPPGPVICQFNGGANPYNGYCMTQSQASAGFPALGDSTCGQWRTDGYSACCLIDYSFGGACSSPNTHCCIYPPL